MKNSYRKKVSQKIKDILVVFSKNVDKNEFKDINIVGVKLI